jgi:hypothetical protein
MTVMARLERVERENRRWKIVGCATLLLLGVALLMAATTSRVPDEIRARRFALIDKNGKQRAVLGTSEASQEMFSMPGESLHGGGLTIFDSNGRLRAAMYVTAEGDAKFIAYDKTEQALARFGVLDSGAATLGLGGLDGKDRASIEVSGNAPALVFRDDSRRQRVVLGGFTLWPVPGERIDVSKPGRAEIRPTSSIVLIGDDGEILWKAP